MYYKKKRTNSYLLFKINFCLKKNKIKGTIYKLTLNVLIRVLFLKIKNLLFRWTNKKSLFQIILG